MGHTLIARFNRESEQKLLKILSKASASGMNKIPYGRTKDRESANRVIPYHCTIFHWGKEEDGHYLPALEDFRFEGCQVSAQSIEICPGRENSWTLLMVLRGEAGFAKMTRELERRFKVSLDSLWHTTIAVDMRKDILLDMRQRLMEKTDFPVRLDVEALELYHIWEPVKRVGIWKREVIICR